MAAEAVFFGQRVRGTLYSTDPPFIIGAMWSEVPGYRFRYAHIMHGVAKMVPTELLNEMVLLNS